MLGGGWGNEAFQHSSVFFSQIVRHFVVYVATDLISCNLIIFTMLQYQPTPTPRHCNCNAYGKRVTLWRKIYGPHMATKPFLSYQETGWVQGRGEKKKRWRYLIWTTRSTLWQARQHTAENSLLRVGAISRLFQQRLFKSFSICGCNIVVCTRQCFTYEK